MANETASETAPQPDPLQDVHSREFWEHSWQNIQTDLRNLDSLPPETPVVDRLRQEVGVLIAITLHQERVLALLARDTAPKPKRSSTRKAKPAPGDEQDA
jgi:hypothetical protein